MGKCLVCGEKAATISDSLGVCLRCIREKPEQALEITRRVHTKSRAVFGLPSEPPKDAGGLSCGVCANNCRIGAGNSGFCGLVWNVDGRLVRFGGTAEKGVLEWYYDGLPTNCVSWWFCPGCTGKGYPKYAYKPEAEYGYSNLAIFYGACSYDCLFCQNWHYRNMSVKHKPVMSAEALAGKVDKHVSCICYDTSESWKVIKKVNVSCICFFGGDPSPQMPHALRTGELALEKARREKRILRICWETNGYWRDKFALKAAELSLVSGGMVKVDLKTWDENLNKALCGVSNKPTLHSFKMIGKKFFKRRPELPVLTASTLLIPGYVDVEEVDSLARFIAEINPRIPYTLLAFYPCYVMNDLPITSRKQAYECLSVAEEHLEKVRLDNVHLLS